MKIFNKFLLSILISFLFFGVFLKSSFCQEKFDKEMAKNWYQENGLNKFNQSNFKQDFYQLVNFYQPQNNPSYCGIATSVILLNAIFHQHEIPSQKTNQLEIKNHQEKIVLEFHSFTQQNFLNEKTDKIKKKSLIDFSEAKYSNESEVIYDAGLSLAELSSMLEIYGLKTIKNHIKNCSDKNLAIIRSDFKKYLSDDKNFIVVNFDGRELEKTTHGHISPVVVYDQISDQVLIMDVALHKNHWHWADLKKLCNSMNTLDGDKKRGYLIISKKQK